MWFRGVRKRKVIRPHQPHIMSLVHDCVASSGYPQQYPASLSCLDVLMGRVAYSKG